MSDQEKDLEILVLRKQLVTRGLQQIETKVKEWTKPAPDRQITGLATDLLPHKPDWLPKGYPPQPLWKAVKTLIYFN